MRAVAVLLLLLLAGCSGPGRPAGDASKDQPAGDLALQLPAADRLTARLPASSGEFQPFEVTEDSVAVPGGGFMHFNTGRGMHCFGDVDSVAPNGTQGWVECAVRLAGDPQAESRNGHELGIGEDNTRLSLRMASEPVEWQVRVVAVDPGNRSDPAGRVLYDSGWRPVDLSPSIDDPLLSVKVVDPCDVPDAQEGQSALGPRRGIAELSLASLARHGRVSIAVDTGRSHPVDTQKGPNDVQTVGDHDYLGIWKVIGSPRPIDFVLNVDLEAPEAPDGSATDPACGATLSHEAQEWTVLLSISGADGRTVTALRTVQVDVALSVQP